MSESTKIFFEKMNISPFYGTLHLIKYKCKAEGGNTLFHSFLTFLLHFLTFSLSFLFLCVS